MALVCAGGCRRDTGVDVQQVDIRGTITGVIPASSEMSARKIVGFIMVEGTTDADTEHDKAAITITDTTIIVDIRTKRAVRFSDLKKGARVEATFTGPVLESYPVQVTAKWIGIIDMDTSDPAPDTVKSLQVTPPQKPMAIDIRGKVVETIPPPNSYVRINLLGTIRVEGSVEPDTHYDKAVVRIDTETVITQLPERTTLRYSDLVVGDSVEIEFSGPVLESYPLKGVARNISIIRKRP